MTARGNSLASRDIATVIHPYTNLSTHQKDGPLVITRGKGVYVYDEAGKAYLEGLAGLWCASLGFDDERLVAAATRQMQALPFYHAFASKSHDAGIALAEKLLAMMPVPMSKVFFANSGSEANDTAIKLIWYYNNALGRPQKKKIISRQRAYHGVTVAAASLTGLPANHRDFDLPIANILHTDCPHHYLFGEPGESEEAFAGRMAANLEALILREGPETVAAFFAEPVVGTSATGLVPHADYYRRVRAICDRYEVLFVADEVLCGYGRTGLPFAIAAWGVEADIITLGKALASGYAPLAAMVVSERVREAFAKGSGRFVHGFTYSGTASSCFVGLKVHEIMQSEGLFARPAEAGSLLMAKLNAVAAKHQAIGEVRGRGLLIGIEFVADRKTRVPFPPEFGLTAKIVKAMRDRNVLVAAGAPLSNLGRHGDHIQISPPYTIGEKEICLIAETLDEVLEVAKI